MKRKSDVAHTKSILNAASNQAVTWTIGSKPNANRDRNDPTVGNVRRQRSNQVGAGRPRRMLYGVDGSTLECGKKTDLLDGSERHRGRRHSSRGFTESLAASVDIPVRIQLSHLDD
jgi:hypothetical protein